MVEMPEDCFPGAELYDLELATPFKIAIQVAVDMMATRNDRLKKR